MTAKAVSNSDNVCVELYCLFEREREREERDLASDDLQESAKAKLKLLCLAVQCKVD